MALLPLFKELAIVTKKMIIYILNCKFLSLDFKAHT